MQNNKKILFVSDSSPQRINHILDAFKNRTELVIRVEHLWIDKNKINFLTKIFNKLKIPLDIDNLNNRLITAVKEFTPDIVFIVKGNNIYPWTIKAIKVKCPHIQLISWSLDDMYAWHNRSLYYTFGLKYYDFVFTSKSYNVKELKSIGAKKVTFLYQAFSKKYHRPSKNCMLAKYKADVVFIGYAEKERFEDMIFLAEHGIEIHIYGSGWKKKRFLNHHKNLHVNCYDLLGEDYADTISCSLITLCFLRKINRDLHTSRSIEIPACGGFMLAERTNEHSKLFEDNKEAIYFNSKDELLAKVRYYLENEDERRTIAANGHERCKVSDYTYDDMVKRIIDDISL